MLSLPIFLFCIILPFVLAWIIEKILESIQMIPFNLRQMVLAKQGDMPQHQSRRTQQSVKEDIPPDAIYIIHFQDHRWRFAAAYHPDDIQGYETIPYNSTERILTPYQFTYKYFKDAIPYNTLAQILPKAIEFRNKNYPDLPIIAYPGDYETQGCSKFGSFTGDD